MEINEIAAIISNPKKTEKQINMAAVHIMAYVQQNPAVFKLANINEDELSDFIYSMYSCFKHICREYEKTRSPFVPYLKKIIFQRFISWRRACLKDYAMNRSIIHEYVKNNELYACESEPEYLADQGTEVSFLQSYRKEDLLVLALKYCYYLSAKSIRRLADVTGIPLEKITDCIMKLNKAVKPKQEYYETKMNCLSRSYMLKKRYMFELERMSDLYGVQAERVLFSYKAQKKKCKKLREEVSTLRVFPSNSAISRVTGISYRRVGRILHRMRNIAGGLF
ncbi:MAG: hypothetical protein J6T84_03850 [Spirochaetaceae bacterium]|nr:hypothetical protein [Spirochaetaceae bacterium]